MKIRKKITSFLLIIIILLLNSCSYYFQLKKEQENKTKRFPILKTPCYCLESNNKLIISGDNKNSVEHFKVFLNKIKKISNLSFIDQIVLWALLQMNLKPELSSPTSRFQGVIYFNKKYIHFDFFAKDSTNAPSYPFLFGLEHLLKKFKSQKSLIELASLIDSYYSWPFIVDKEMELFLATNIRDLLKHSTFKNTFFKANQPLQENESLMKLSFKKIVSFYLKSKTPKDLYHTTPFLFSYKLPTPSDIDVQCNQDFNLYDNSIYLISNKKQKSNTYSFQTQNDNFFLGINSQFFNKPVPLKNTFLIKGNSLQTKNVFCSIQNKVTSNTIFLFSSKGRDPGQHLYNLIHKHIFSMNSLKELNEILQGPRHLFLVHPYRVVYESNRANKNQLKSFLLQNNAPVYHGQSLGKIWGYGVFKNESGIIFDSRSPFYSTCKSLTKENKL